MACVSRGDYSGEIGLLGGGVRSAACTALDHVELVRISGDDFRDMVARFPSVRTGLEAVAAERHAANQQRMQIVHNVPIDQFLSQGLIDGDVVNNLHALLVGGVSFGDRKSTRLNSSHVRISYTVFCLNKTEQCR